MGKGRLFRREEGFTLIELLVVVLVIGILSGIVVIAVQNQTANARQRACETNATNILQALDTYRAVETVGAYPTAAATAATVTGAPTGTTWKLYTEAELNVLVPKYIKSVPYSGTVDANTAVTVYVRSDALTVGAKLNATGCNGAWASS